MFAIQKLFAFIAFSVISFSGTHGSNVAKQIGNDIELTGKGKVELTITDVLSFTMPKSCEGTLFLCYDAHESSDGQAFNVDANCPPGSCKIFLNPQNAAEKAAVSLTNHLDKITATFDKSSKEFCPMKTVNNRQNFTIVELPKCSVIVNEASLPKADPKEEGDEEVNEESVSEEPKTNLMWLIPLCAGIFCSLAAVGAIGGMIYNIYRGDQKANAAKPKPLKYSMKAVTPTSPAVAPTSPATFPTVSPNTPNTPAKSPAAVETPQREAESKIQTANPESKAPAATVSKAAKPQQNIAEIKNSVKEGLPSLQENSLLVLEGVRPKDTAAHIKKIQDQYTAKPRRQASVYEVEFFLLIVSQAYKEVHDLIKQARRLLCEHGAVYTHGEWRSFNDITRQYIKRSTTPGFVAHYALASEYGSGIKFEDFATAEVILPRLSIPALLLVFLREDVHDRIRRSAYAHMRRQFVTLFKNFTEMQLYVMPYPINLIPEMKKKNAAVFFDSENDKTFSTPLELILQRKKDEVTKEEKETDETQVSNTDGQQRKESARTEVLGSHIAKTTTIKME